MANQNGNEETHDCNNHNGTKIATAHDWEEEKRLSNDFHDYDGTNNFFWRAHRLTVLIVFTCILIYVSMFEDVKVDIEFNTKRGLIAVILTFVLFGVTHTPDGPFRRPHPAFWRLILCLSIVYELALVFLLFQSVDDARQLLKNIDDTLGEPLPEKDYGGNCRIYDKDNPEDPFHNVWDKMDGFVVVHFVGWWIKTLVIRDYWLCMVISIMFEILEYTLEHQLPNFSECWWDHWVMDALVCNWLGIYLGLKTLQYLKMRPYHWRSMWNIPTYRGKLSRLLRQFTPHSWMDFNWKPTSSLGRWVAMLLVTAIFLLAELNTFYLKFVLWIPPPHFLCLGRLVFFVFMGASAMRETFQYMDDPNCSKFGHQSFMILAVIITELLITLKFDWDTITKPLPPHVLLFWTVGATGLVMWTLWHFYLQRLLWPSDLEETKKNGRFIDHGKDGQHDQNFNTSTPERQLRSRKKHEVQ